MPQHTAYFVGSILGVHLKQALTPVQARKLELRKEENGIGVYFLVRARLWVSAERRGVFLKKSEDGHRHILVKLTGDDTFWSIGQAYTILSADEYVTRLIDDAERIKGIIAANIPYTDHQRFQNRLAEIRELRKEELENDRKRAEEKRVLLEKEALDRRYGELRSMAIHFLEGASIDMPDFRDLLKQHGLWPAIAPRTKGFILARLIHIRKDGSYNYVTSKIRGRESRGNQTVCRVAQQLAGVLLPKFPHKMM